MFTFIHNTKHNIDLFDKKKHFEIFLKSFHCTKKVILTNNFHIVLKTFSFELANPHSQFHIR